MRKTGITSYWICNNIFQWLCHKHINIHIFWFELPWNTKIMPRVNELYHLNIYRYTMYIKLKICFTWSLHGHQYMYSLWDHMYVHVYRRLSFDNAGSSVIGLCVWYRLTYKTISWFQNLYSVPCDLRPLCLTIPCILRPYISNTTCIFSV